MNTIITQISSLELSFTTSFKHTALVLYEVNFTENSNLNQILENLKILKNNIEQNISTNKHVGCNINIKDVQVVNELLLSLISSYKTINNITVIQSKLKLYTLLNELRQSQSINVKETAKEILKEVLNPEKTDKKLSKKEQREIEIKESLLKSNLELLKKHSKTTKNKENS